jgi:hypothetical protein
MQPIPVDISQQALSNRANDLSSVATMKACEQPVRHASIKEWLHLVKSVFYAPFALIESALIDSETGVDTKFA